jgi:hypothetical protein
MADISNAELDKLRDVVEEAVTYPVLTKGVNGYGGSRNGHMPASQDGGPLTRTAQGAIRDLIGWRYRADDPKGFVAALNKAIDLKEVEGRVEPTWKKTRPFTVQADLGEVTGAQASIYERARVAVEHALPLLEALKPLRPDADEESTESVRSMVRSALTELVAELACVGGPRIHRINEYFTRLLGVTRFDIAFFQTVEFANLVGHPEDVPGALGELRVRFGLRRELVLIVEEERNFTNFLILVDYTTTLFQTWVAQKSFIERNDQPDKFLGTQLVRLSQMLNVIVESVCEAYDAMDSVFFGPQERAVTEIEFNGEPRITVAELLGWVEHFAGVEAPQLIEDSGKDGVDAVRNTLERLRDLVNSAISQSQNA